IEKSSPNSPIRITFENYSYKIIGNDWSKFIDKELLIDSRKHRKYNFNSVRDYLRLIRNKWNHFEELPKHIQNKFIINNDASNINIAANYYKYFNNHCPNLLILSYKIVG